MNLFESLRTCFKKFIDPVGRARRSEFWWYALFAVAVILVLNLVSRWFYSDVVVTICRIAYIAVVCPMITCMMRRMHDLGKSSLWVFLSIIPVIGWIPLAIMAAKDSQPGENDYGPNPKGVN